MRKTGKSWKNRLAVSSLILAFFWAPIAHTELKVFPMWERMSCPTEEFACYTFDQAKNILTLDLNMQLKLKELDLTKAQVQDLQLAINDLKKASALDKKIITRLDKRAGEKTKKLVEMTNRYIVANKRDVFGGALPWVAMGAILFFGGGALFAHLMSSR